MKRYSVTMTYWKNVEVLANNSREAREKHILAMWK